MASPVSATMLLSFTRTFNASSRKRFPAQAGQIFSDQTSSVPKPWHCGHAPYGLLKEKRRGSISGKEKPSFGHVNLAESDVSLSVITVTTLFPYLSADSTASESRRRLSLFLNSMSPRLRSTTRSIVGVL